MDSKCLLPEHDIKNKTRYEQLELHYSKLDFESCARYSLHYNFFPRSGDHTFTASDHFLQVTRTQHSQEATCSGSSENLFIRNDQCLSRAVHSECHLRDTKRKQNPETFICCQPLHRD